MTSHLKIDRATGNVLVRGDKDDPVRALNKSTVWLPLVSESRPSFDPSTEQIALRLDIPDLADMSRDVAPDAVATEGFDIVALTAEEIARREQDRVDGAILGVGALLDALNDGSFVPGENYTADQIETKIKAQL
jgi:hypothetical protein